jgi:Na+-transporting methylmalonyl-CoA/oxaloacetate decarboxylase gamma subunit
MDSTLALALKISGIGIVVLLLALSLFAFVVSLMTRFMVDKPEEEEDAGEENTQPEIFDNDVKNPDLQMVAAIALALYRDQIESQTAVPLSIAGSNDSWRQFQLHRRLTQSSTIRRTR